MPVAVSIGDTDGLVVQDDGYGITFADGSRIYKAAGGSITLSATQPVYVSNLDGSNTRQLMQTSGATMTGSLVITGANIFRFQDNTTGVNYGHDAYVASDGAGRKTWGLQTGQTGNLPGGNPEGWFYIFTTNGASGYLRLMVTGISNPPTSNWDGAMSAPAFNVSSDKRLKKEVMDLPPEDARLGFEALRPVLFRRKDAAPGEGGTVVTTQPLEYGFVADDIAGAAPHAVTEVQTPGEDPYKAYSLGGVLALAVAEIKRLRAEVDDLKAQQGP